MIPEAWRLCMDVLIGVCMWVADVAKGGGYGRRGVVVQVCVGVLGSTKMFEKRLGNGPNVTYQSQLEPEDNWQMRELWGMVF